ncbi:MAG TPA: glycoside hydrolase domain-containing protein [Phycisphaerae bacterium]|nr:glycoside hydrolase domain-containing protein [Phycisphaerae bacterium]
MNRIRCCSVAACLVVWVCVPAALGQPAAAPVGTAAADERSVPAGAVVLNDRHFWRKYYCFFPPSLSVQSARAEGLPTDADARRRFLEGNYPGHIQTPPPSAGWTDPDFDDHTWMLLRGRQFLVGDARMLGDANSPDDSTPYTRGTDPFLPGCGLVAQRGAFTVTDPAAVRSLTLRVVYRGGFVAYLNGKEIARAGLPAGELEPTTPAADYPLEAWFLRGGGQDKKSVLHWFNHSKSDQWALRERTFGPVRVPRDALRRGRNVLALAMHRSDYPAASKLKFGHLESPTLYWAPVGLSRLELRAEGDGGAAAGLEARRRGVQVWPVEITQALSDRTVPNHDQHLAPVRIAAVRNGRFAGQVLVTSEQPLEGLRAEPGELARAGGAGRIPASAVEIRYGAVNPTRPAGFHGGLSYHDTVLPPDFRVGRMADLGTRFDLLLADPPAGVSAVPVWMTVAVPKDAATGEYRGQVTIRLTGRDPIQVPIELTVFDHTLPDVKDRVGIVDIYQSPDTLADTYKVKPWSDEHWALIEESMKLIGAAGGITVRIPLLAQSSFGNAESMIPWIKEGDGYAYDLSNFDRYVDLAARHYVRLRWVVVNVWDRTALPEASKDSRVTVIDKATGEKTTLRLSSEAYTNPKLWRALVLEIHEHLKRKGLADRMIYGTGTDQSPTAAQVAMFRDFLPQLRWVRESHFGCRQYVYDAATRAAVPVAYTSQVWGGQLSDPAVKRPRGWAIDPDHIVVNFNRAGVSCPCLNEYAPPGAYRYWMEGALTMGRNGYGRCGGDYWNLGSAVGDGWNIGTRFCMYPDSCLWALGIAHGVPDVLGPGPEAPVTTVRFENARQGNQEAEVRVFVEKALTDKQHPLPEGLAGRLQAMLDARTNRMRLDVPASSQAELRELFSAAVEVARALARGSAGPEAPR